MKQFIRLLILSGLLIPFTCATAQVNVFACEPEWAELTKILGGNHVKIYRATHARQDPHRIQARPSLIARLRNADLAVCTGAELEAAWMPMLQRRARNPKVLPGKPGYFEATDQVRLLERPRRLDRTGGDVHAEGNPHIHLDPRRIRRVAAVLAKRLQTIDPKHSNSYQKRWKAFDKRWRDSMARWKQQAKPLQGKTAVVYHREWVYLLDWLAIKRIGSLEPNPGVPPTPSHISKLSSLQKPDMIIMSPLNDKKPATWLRDKSGGRLVTLPHTVGAVGAAKDYFKLFDTIISRLLKSGT